MLSGKWVALLHPILAGFFGFNATCIGSHFFKAEHPWQYIGVGILLYVVADRIMFKFSINSYQLNGATITTIFVFISQTLCMAISKNDITPRWLVGIALVIAGTVLVKLDEMGTKVDYSEVEQQVEPTQLII